jgi:hypothetical protein
MMVGLLVFLQAFPKLGCLAPSFSKQIFGRFVGFQGVASLKNLNDVSLQIFWAAPASLQPYSRRHRAAFRRLAPKPDGGSRVRIAAG